MSEARDWMPGYHLGMILDLRRVAAARRQRKITRSTFVTWLACMVIMVMTWMIADDISAFWHREPVGSVVILPDYPDDADDPGQWCHGANMRSI